MGERKHPWQLPTVVFEELSQLTVQEDYTVGVLIYCLNGLNWSIICVEASEDLPQACMPGPVKRLPEVYEVLEQLVLVL